MNVHIQLLRLLRALHDEAKPRRRVLAHQLVDHAIGRRADPDTSTRSSRRVRGLSVVSHSTFGIISPRPLNRVISGRRAPGLLLHDLLLLRVVQRPVRFLADVDAIERRLREIDLARWR